MPKSLERVVRYQYYIIALVLLTLVVGVLGVVQDYNIPFPGGMAGAGVGRPQVDPINGECNQSGFRMECPPGDPDVCCKSDGSAFCIEVRFLWASAMCEWCCNPKILTNATRESCTNATNSSECTSRTNCKWRTDSSASECGTPIPELTPPPSPLSSPPASPESSP